MHTMTHLYVRSHTCVQLMAVGQQQQQQQPHPTVTGPYLPSYNAIQQQMMQQYQARQSADSGPPYPGVIMGTKSLAGLNLWSRVSSFAGGSRGGSPKREVRERLINHLQLFENARSKKEGRIACLHFMDCFAEAWKSLGVNHSTTACRVTTTLRARSSHKQTAGVSTCPQI